MRTLVRTVFAQSAADQVTAQFARVIDQLQDKFHAAAEFLTDAEDDLLAFAKLQGGARRRRAGSTSLPVDQNTWSSPQLAGAAGGRRRRGHQEEPRHRLKGREHPGFRAALSDALQSSLI